MGSSRVFCSVLCWLGFPGLLAAQAVPEFTAIQALTNREVALKLSGVVGLNYRIDAATTLPSWSPLVTLTGNTVTLQHTDTAAPYLNTRFYRAAVERVGSERELMLARRIQESFLLSEFPRRLGWSAERCPANPSFWRFSVRRCKFRRS